MTTFDYVAIIIFIVGILGGGVLIALAFDDFD